MATKFSENENKAINMKATKPARSLYLKMQGWFIKVNDSIDFSSFLIARAKAQAIIKLLEEWNLNQF